MYWALRDLFLNFIYILYAESKQNMNPSIIILIYSYINILYCKCWQKELVCCKIKVCFTPAPQNTL